MPYMQILISLGPKTCPVGIHLSYHQSGSMLVSGEVRRHGSLLFLQFSSIKIVLFIEVTNYLILVSYLFIRQMVKTFPR